MNLVERICLAFLQWKVTEKSTIFVAHKKIVPVKFLLSYEGNTTNVLGYLTVVYTLKVEKLWINTIL